MVKQTVKNDKPCVCTSNYPVNKWIKNEEVFKYFKDNMEIIELVEFNLFGKYPKSTISSTQ